MKVRRILCVCFVLLAMMLSFAVSAAPVIPADDNSVESETSAVSPRAEETQWVYRVYEGRLQKRLWSYTRGIWLTEWEDC